VASLLELGLKTLREAFTLSRVARLGFAEIQMVINGQRSHSHRICGDSSEPLATLLAVSLKSVDAGAWSYLMHESGLRTFMDATARKEWDEKIYAQDVPPLTVENIEATFSTLHSARGDMFERGVLAVFRSLSWNYKTNEPFKFGKRIIVDDLFHSCGVAPWNRGATVWAGCIMMQLALAVANGLQQGAPAPCVGLGDKPSGKGGSGLAVTWL